METISVNPVGKLAAALAKAQAEMHNPAFDRENPHFRSKFASLAAVRNAVIPTLAKHGVALLQNVTTSEKGVACETILLHESGETLRLGPLVLPATKPDAQGLGSATTYARRYALMAVAGVVGDDDDDGEAAVGRQNGRYAHSPKDGLGEADPEVAAQYAEAMLAALDSGNADKVRALHAELNADPATYAAAGDLAQRNRKKFKTDWRSVVRGEA